MRWLVSPAPRSTSAHSPTSVREHQQEWPDLPYRGPEAQGPIADRDHRGSHPLPLQGPEDHQKPVRLWELPILHHTTTRDTLYDPFCGSGTAVIAAEKTGRTCVAIDLDPQYIHVTRTRWEAFTGQRARPLPVRRRATGGSDA